ncbi:S9 family peptidase [Pedobacter sp. SD-b]|uniref:S9 family peptidase n=1 Tax=Pedobacter segetis TaxID=2793069 RepID=A0ABS1BJC2_9SPHI|nr:prolyl oligopeptidase family serine peptidase [Pedobacter segetis]MBK0382979.1 S9 family peptidase [Pedobacter segetis]
MTFYKIKKCAFFTFFIVSAFSLDVSFAQEVTGYQKPPESIAKIVDESVSRTVILSGRAKYMAILEQPGYPSIKEIAAPYEKLAGLRVNPQNYGNQRSALYTSLKFKKIDSNEDFELLNIPKDAQIKNVVFCPDESKVAFSITTDTEIELWLGDLETKYAKRLTNFALNDAYGTLLKWSPDSKTILAKFKIDQKSLKSISAQSAGPNIQESTGKPSPNRTYQDLLKNPNDELKLDYYLTAQLKMVYLDGQAVNYSRPDIYKSFDFSPDGELVMLSVIHKPYSYIVPIEDFPYKIEVRDRYGKLVQDFADVPLADNLPQGFDAVINGPREFEWRADKPQTIFWAEAQDGGDPNKPSTIRDVLYTRKATEPYGTKLKLADCYLRFNKIDWGDDQIALVTERWWKTKAERRVFIKPGNDSYRVNLWDRYSEDAYSDPGEFVKVKNQYNRDVLLLDYSVIRRATDPNNINIFSISDGASPIGDRPFLLQFNVKTKLTDTLFHSRAPFYEKPIFFDNKDNLIISRESVAEPANYFNLDYRKGKTQQLTFFKNPYPQLFGINKQLLNYKREDNLNLTANLYLPIGYTVGQGKLPVLMWAYPKEYKTAAAAGQVKGSPYRFSKISWASPIYWVTRGYAVMDNVDMPIVGESNDYPNDTFIEQLQENALAAVNKIVGMGIGDAKRIAIGGHSYGAFMTANLLAHTNLFAAGIARSGAYNRTLTPNGFQAEERTYWQAPELYYKMSPFSYADKIKAPLLLIHGEADDNPGTFPIQSERFYSALKGFGAITRLVYLPYEAHSYRAKESILHMLWEMDSWLDKYVKNK